MTCDHRPHSRMHFSVDSGQRPESEALRRSTTMKARTSGRPGFHPTEACLRGKWLLRHAPTSATFRCSDVALTGANVVALSDDIGGAVVDRPSHASTVWPAANLSIEQISQLPTARYSSPLTARRPWSECAPRSQPSFPTPPWLALWANCAPPTHCC